MALEKYCTNAEISKIQVIAKPLTKGPCHGIITCTKDGESEANKLNAAKTIQFHVKNLGIFTVQQQQDGKICMNFPIRAAQKVEDYPDILRQALTKPFKNVYINAQAYIVELCTRQK